MTAYSVARTIAASPEAIWALLTNAEGYKEWNPTIVSLDGMISLDNKIKVVSTVNPKRAFKLTVTEMDEPNRMVWANGMPLGLFQGVRTYTLTPTAGGQTEFSMIEEFTGLLESLISKSIPDMTDSFEAFADGLKQAAESGS
jgi:hypothetical protein